MPAFRPGATRRLVLLASAIAALGTGLASPHARAQAAYPSRPIRLVVPFPAGGGTDLIAREVANKVTATQGWSIVVDNKPGSAGNLGVDAAAKAAPDGYTLVMGQTSNMAVNPTLYPKLPYKPAQDLTPVALVAEAPVLLVVAADAPYKTLAELVAAAKARPETLNYASAGSGTVSHLAVELLQKAAGVKLTHVPYKGASQGATDLIGGQIQVFAGTVPTLIGYIRNGKMRALAVTSTKRLPDLANVPTVAESGYVGFDAVTWFGIAGPAKLPKDVVTKLHTAFSQATQDADVRSKLAGQGATVRSGTPEQFSALVRDDIVRWGKVVRDSGAKVD